MLIACEPKSASSAFARGMSEILDIYTIQRQLEPHKSYVLKVLKGGRGQPPSHEIAFHPEYPTLSRIHPDTNDIPEKLIRRFLLSETTLYKQAIIPTERHIQIIRKYLPYSRGLIVLVRNPADAVNAYRKHYSHGNGLYDIGFEYWNAAAIDHRKFVKQYIEVFAGESRVHFVCYERLMLYTATVMNECLEFLGFHVRVPSDYELPKRRFTGQGIERLTNNEKLRCAFSNVHGEFNVYELMKIYGLQEPLALEPQSKRYEAAESFCPPMVGAVVGNL